MRSTDQRGVAHLGLIVVLILVLAVVAFAFWRVQEQPAEETQQPTTTQVEESDAIENEADLEAAEEELQGTDIDAELDVDELDDALQ